jgi:ABC-type branched-subunit amino acid transport system permease subunit
MKIAAKGGVLIVILANHFAGYTISLPHIRLKTICKVLMTMGFGSLFFYVLKLSQIVTQERQLNICCCTVGSQALNTYLPATTIKTLQVRSIYFHCRLEDDAVVVLSSPFRALVRQLL